MEYDSGIDFSRQNSWMGSEMENGSSEPIARPEIGLAHELLGRSVDANESNMKGEKYKGLELNEYQASHVENEVRSELRIPLRDYYAYRISIDEKGMKSYELSIRSVIEGYEKYFVSKRWLFKRKSSFPITNLGS
jgi:hypothetical protein